MKYTLQEQESERLIFRLLEKDDFKVWLSLFEVDNIAEFLGLDPKLTKEELCQLWFDKVFNRYDNDLGGMNVLIEKGTNKLVGQCGLLIQNVDSKERLEIGYSILPKFWNLGFASEAAKKCRDYAFENDFSESLISIVHVDNVSSKRVALNNGMHIIKHRTDLDGSPMDIFMIDKKEWLSLA